MMAQVAEHKPSTGRAMSSKPAPGGPNSAESRSLSLVLPMENPGSRGRT